MLSYVIINVWNRYLALLEDIGAFQSSKILCSSFHVYFVSPNQMVMHKTSAFSCPQDTEEMGKKKKAIV